MHSGDLDGKEVQKGRGYTCISTTGSLCCTVETNTKLKSNYGGGLVAKSHPTLATPWTPGPSIGVGCHFLLQIFLTQGLNLGSFILQVVSCIVGRFFTD